MAISIKAYTDELFPLVLMFKLLFENAICQTGQEQYKHYLPNASKLIDIDQYKEIFFYLENMSCL